MAVEIERKYLIDSEKLGTLKNHLFELDETPYLLYDLLVV